MLSKLQPLYRGWMGDAGLSIDETLFNFDYVNFYLNFLTMISDNQLPDGSVSDTVPFTVGFSPADPKLGYSICNNYMAFI